MKQLNMVGQPCPIPVIQARKTLMAGEPMVEVLVDNEIAVQNLEKMATGEGYGFAWKPLEEGRFQVTLTRGEAPGASPALAVQAPQLAPQKPQGMTVLIGREGLGAGAEELGRLLMKGFLFSLTELPAPPERLIFLNGGAKLTTQGANTVPDLQTLADKGTEIYTCGTCANFFGIKDALAVGQLTDMMHIAEMLAEAGKLVSL